MHYLPYTSVVVLLCCAVMSFAVDHDLARGYDGSVGDS